ncbi:hypothetical protein ACFL26_00655 [Patescibacteria group bacterium]
MPKWKIIIPVLIVVVVATIGYMQLTGGPGESPPAAPAADVPEAGSEDLTQVADEPVEDQVDALIESMAGELREEQRAVEAWKMDYEALTVGDSDLDILNASYYEE